MVSPRRPRSLPIKVYRARFSKQKHQKTVLKKDKVYEAKRAIINALTDGRITRRTETDLRRQLAGFLKSRSSQATLSVIDMNKRSRVSLRIRHNQIFLVISPLKIFSRRPRSPKGAKIGNERIARIAFQVVVDASANHSIGRKLATKLLNVLEDFKTDTVAREYSHSFRDIDTGNKIILKIGSNEIFLIVEPPEPEL